MTLKGTRSRKGHITVISVTILVSSQSMLKVSTQVSEWSWHHQTSENRYRNYDIFTSIIVQLLTSRLFPDLCTSVRIELTHSFFFLFQAWKCAAFLWNSSFVFHPNFWSWCLVQIWDLKMHWEEGKLDWIHQNLLATWQAPATPGLFSWSFFSQQQQIC